MADTRVVGFGPFRFWWEREWEEQADAEAEEELRIADGTDRLPEPLAPVGGAAELDAKAPHPGDEPDTMELPVDDDSLQMVDEAVPGARDKDKVAVAEPHQPLTGELTQEEVQTLRRLAESSLDGENLAIRDEDADRIARKVGVGSISEAVEMYVATVPELRSRSGLTRGQSVDSVLDSLETGSLKPEEVLSLFDAIRSELDRFDVQERRLGRLNEDELQGIRDFIDTIQAANGDMVAIPPLESILMLKLGVGSISEAMALYLAVTDRPGDDVIGNTKHQSGSMDKSESGTRRPRGTTKGASTRTRGEGEDARGT